MSRLSPETTIGDTLAQLNELNKTGRPYDQAVKHLADDRSGIDYATHGALQPFAKTVLADKPGAREELARAARRRMDELREHKRVNPASASLRYFCGMLRVIFSADAAPEMRRSDEGWGNLRRFAMEVFMIAGIDHADFDAHPERLTAYLGTDVTSGNSPNALRNSSRGSIKNSLSTMMPSPLSSRRSVSSWASANQHTKRRPIGFTADLEGKPQQLTPMIRPDIEPVYLPHNERYLGQPHLLAFDKVIPAAMRTNLEVARRTFVKPLSPLQIRRLIERASSRPPSTRL